MEADSKVVHVTSATWKAEVLDSPLPVVVDFWAEWCRPCRMLAPILDELASEMDGKLKFAKLDVAENGDLSTQLGIRSIPTLLVVQGGQIRGQMVGAMSKAQLKDKLATYL